MATQKDKSGDRRDIVKKVRNNAYALTQPPRDQKHNLERETLGSPYPTSFTKGLPHNEYGMVDGNDFDTFFNAITTPDSSFHVPLGPENSFLTQRQAEDVGSSGETAWSVRGWESPLAGHAFDLQGPDADSVAMAPAPRLGSDELAAELAEVYAMAILRDTSFEDMRKGDARTDTVVTSLAKLSWFNEERTPTDVDGGQLSASSSRRRERTLDGKTKMPLTRDNLFRGSTPGETDGPYISQFLLQGSASRTANISDTTVLRQGDLSKGYTMVATGEEKNGQLVYREATAADGYIAYGPQRIDQRIHAQKANIDYLQNWDEWLDVQNGADVGAIQDFEEDKIPLRFIHTPRDLASYVHIDALYQAYLNACLLLLAVNAAGDAGLPEPNNTDNDGKPATRTPFATFGGPHILTLVTEDATLALKAVRRQKYNVHCRARPEALAAITTLTATGHGEHLGKQGKAKGEDHCNKIADADELLAMVKALNDSATPHTEQTDLGKKAKLPDISARNLLLPMAFPEGSPMHPAYGAGHATVAGTCVTILKSFFQMYAEDGVTLLNLSEVGDGSPLGTVFVAGANGASLEEYEGDTTKPLTLAGELNKLAANISIGRNMAGVHYYSDYYDSLRMGERIAIGILEEQMCTYAEPMSMTLPSFDGDTLKLDVDRNGQTSLIVTDRQGAATSREDWFARHTPSGPVPSAGA